MKYVMYEAYNRIAIGHKKHEKTALTWMPGCSQNSGIEPRIWMNEDTLSSRKMTWQREKE